MTNYLQAVEKAQEQAQLDALDAARYRWLRDRWDGSSPWQDMELLRDGGADMDAAIDAAIAAEKKEGA